MTISFVESEWARDRQDEGLAIFVAKLSDGRTVYQDGDLSLAWRSLSQFLKTNGLTIQWLRLKFRTEWFCGVSDNSPAYYLSKGVGGVFGGPVISFISIGHLTGKVFRTAQVAVPTLEVLVVSDRDIAPDDPRIIWNGN